MLYNVEELEKEMKTMAKYQVLGGCCYCQECLFACPKGAIKMDKDGAHIDEEKCVGCGICANNCASEAILKLDK